MFWGKLKREETRVAAIMENPEYPDDLEVTDSIISELLPLHEILFKFVGDILTIYFLLRSGCYQ